MLSHTLAPLAWVGLLTLACAGHATNVKHTQEAIMEQMKIAGTQGDLFVEQAGHGDGLSVLFLHADSGRASQWREVAHDLAKERRTVAFDFRGSGESDPARNGDYSYAGRADDVGSVWDALSLSQAVIVAHSGGAAVALEYAARHAGRVAGLLLVDPPTNPRALPQQVRDGFVSDLAGPHSLQVQKDYYRTIVGENAVTRERVLIDCESVVPAARAGNGLAFATWDPEPTLNAWQGQALVLATPANDNEHALYRLRNDLQHRLVTGAGHWIQLDQPLIVEQAIRDFLAALETQP
ncbi:MAG TPA: alpha/beta hydrolase [Polyangiaceae bacterium]